MKSSGHARLADVSVYTLRYCHAIGLLPEPPRGENGYREYEPAYLLRLLRIRQLASLGFSLENMVSAHYNDAQIATSDELFARFTRHMVERAECGRWITSPER